MVHFACRFSVIVNGTPTGFFQSSRGLQQGEPLPPYLFVVAIKALSCLLRRATDGGYILRSNGSFMLITHVVEACSGLKVNLEKSELIPTGRVERVEELVSKLGCKEGKLPSTYLGLPLDAPFRSVAVWDRVKERTIKLRLEKIQREFLCGGGRLEKKFHPVKWSTMCLGKSTPSYFKRGMGGGSLGLDREERSLETLVFQYL
ncbi:hypothetical protein CK203_035739 [Vitis vinifera]|uniref:Reverse transcriptase domain-containing protein n=1 Tax=Vitis vinifera TaxID=29760 RepID=A0A438ICI4_VITVI|nr:hypothetical protein CK203_035739 [Vitis vinifera]